MKPIKTTKKALRRFLLEHQQLLNPTIVNIHSPLHERVYQMITQLECVQLDPVAAVSTNQHLVLSARIPNLPPEVLNDLLSTNHIFEYFANAACIIPMEDYPIFEPKRKAIEARLLPELSALGTVAEEVLQRLDDEGPLPAKAFTSDQIVHGYWDNQAASTKATSHALNLLMDMAHIRVVERVGKQRLYDLTRRTVPPALLEQAERIDPKVALHALLQKYLRAYRVFEPSDARFGWQKLTAKERRESIAQGVQAEHIIPVQIEGVERLYYILTADAKKLMEHIGDEQHNEVQDGQSIYFLPPLDNLLWSRQRLEDLFDFTYRWEIYTPATKRKYGYYAMPILAGDKLIGRIDPRLDRTKRHLHIERLQFEAQVEKDKALKEHVHNAIRRFACTHGAESFSVENGKTISAY